MSAAGDAPVFLGTTFADGVEAPEGEEAAGGPV